MECFWGMLSGFVLLGVLGGLYGFLCIGMTGSADMERWGIVSGALDSAGCINHVSREVQKMQSCQPSTVP